MPIGSIIRTKSGRFRVNFGNDYVGQYPTKREAKAAIAAVLKGNPPPKRNSRKPGTGNIEQNLVTGRFRGRLTRQGITYRTKYYATRKEAESALSRLIKPR